MLALGLDTLTMTFDVIRSLVLMRLQNCSMMFHIIIFHKESDLPYVVVFLRLIGYHANYLLVNLFISVTSQGIT